MKKRFVKKKRKALKIPIIFLFLLIIMSIFDLKLNNAFIINNLIYHMDSYLKTFIVNNKISYLNYAFNLKEDYLDLELEDLSLGEYIKDYNTTTVSNPIIYIYNSHQTESYQKSNLNEYNVNPTVLLASYILRDNLNNKGLNTLVETTDLGAILKKENLPYRYSYQISKGVIEPVIKENNFHLIIDLHRDSSKYEKTTLNYNNKNYAKILFVVGKEHDNWQENYSVSKKLNELVNSKIPGLSKGISIKEGKGVNGIYNQDLNSQMVLIEIGGQYNSIGEVTNTLEVLSEVIKAYETN